MRPSILVALAATGIATAGAASAQETTFVAIGTGGVTGVYYPAGGAICRLVNQGRSEHGIRCGVESTGGSIFNLNALRDQELEMGIVQTDWQYHAYNGTSDFEDDAFEGLRAVFSLHPEPFTVVARADAEISSFDDLQGKRVNVGNPGSGQRATMEVVMEAMGWTMDDFGVVSELQAGEQAQALCDNNIDAMVYTVGHPSGAIEEATTACDTVIVPVDNEAVSGLVEDNSYYREATIPGGMYRGTEDDVLTFGVGASFVTADFVDEETVYQVTKAVMDNLDDFRELHPALGILVREEMVTDGISAPLHPGAERYYEEEGLLDN